MNITPTQTWKAAYCVQHPEDMSLLFDSIDLIPPTLRHKAFTKKPWVALPEDCYAEYVAAVRASI